MEEFESTTTAFAVEAQMQKFWDDNRVYAFAPDKSRPIYSIDTPPPTVSGSLYRPYFQLYAGGDDRQIQAHAGLQRLLPLWVDDNGLPSERLVERNPASRRGICPAASSAKSAWRPRRNTRRSSRRCGKPWASPATGIWNTPPSARIPSACPRNPLSSLRRPAGPISKRIPRAVVHGVPDLDRTGRAGVQGSGVLLPLPEILCRRQGAGDRHNAAGTAVRRGMRLCKPGRRAVLQRDIVGKMARVPCTTSVPILTDERSASTKGTGAVMCATFGDSTDVEWVEQHNLPYKSYSALWEDRRIRPFIAGLRVKAARKGDRAPARGRKGC